MLERCEGQKDLLKAVPIQQRSAYLPIQLPEQLVETQMDQKIAHDMEIKDTDNYQRFSPVVPLK